MAAGESPGARVPIVLAEWTIHKTAKTKQKTSILFTTNLAPSEWYEKSQATCRNIPTTIPTMEKDSVIGG
jgi:hypothetical protein